MNPFRKVLRNARRKRKLARLIRSQRPFYPESVHSKFSEIIRHFDEKSLSTWEEQAALFELAYEAPENPVIVEVGSWIGNGTCLLAGGARGPSPRVFAIDAFCAMTANEQEKALYEKFLRRVTPDLSQREFFDRNLARFHLQKKVTAVPFPSDQALPHLSLQPGTVDLLFIDGGHTLEVVRQDIALYVPLVKPGGVVAFHDFDTGPPGVTAAVWEEVMRGTFPNYVRKRGSLLALRKG